MELSRDDGASRQDPGSGRPFNLKNMPGMQESSTNSSPSRAASTKQNPLKKIYEKNHPDLPDENLYQDGSNMDRLPELGQRRRLSVLTHTAAPLPALPGSASRRISLGFGGGETDPPIQQRARARSVVAAPTHEPEVPSPQRFRGRRASASVFSKNEKPMLSLDPDIAQRASILASKGPRLVPDAGEDPGNPRLPKMRSRTVSGEDGVGLDSRLFGKLKKYADALESDDSVPRSASDAVEQPPSSDRPTFTRRRSITADILDFALPPKPTISSRLQNLGMSIRQYLQESIMANQRSSATIKKFKAAVRRAIIIWLTARAFKCSLQHDGAEVCHGLSGMWESTVLSTEVRALFARPQFTWTNEDWKKLKDTLNAIPGWALRFTDEIREMLIARMTLEMHTSGTVLFRKGHRADGCYLLIKGQCKAAGADDKDFFRPGDMIGETEFSVEDKTVLRRPNTIACQSDCAMMHIGGDDFLEIMDIEGHAVKKADLIIELFQTLPLFSGCSRRTMSFFAQACETVFVDAKQVVLTQGDPIRYLYIILTGTVDVIKVIYLTRHDDNYQLVRLRSDEYQSLYRDSGHVKEKLLSIRSLKSGDSFPYISPDIHAPTDVSFVAAMKGEYLKIKLPWMVLLHISSTDLWSQSDIYDEDEGAELRARLADQHAESEAQIALIEETYCLQKNKEIAKRNLRKDLLPDLSTLAESESKTERLPDLATALPHGDLSRRRAGF
ncbi:uncharacterized protein BJ171DRAFT_597174 [Polychytrium aggregatum]|uniref:uncharacterized protein n=1 Tax=Polychytrium aggregatum TaxID=110093 RepID=UPI0022FE765C|nr:uncharacterized protein BJ171DRAFT_597174 [Polychytrium aggregatum]KAI9207068.1 hypothetical protein BJ171DRAFT_597174 [Polychytrium aggregatum]